MLRCFGACLSSDAGTGPSGAADACTPGPAPAPKGSQPLHPTQQSLVSKASVGITVSATAGGATKQQQHKEPCHSGRPRVVLAKAVANDQLTTFVSVDIAGYRQLSSVHGLAKMTRLLDRLVLLFNGLCVTHNMQRLHLSGRRRPLVACAAVPLDWASNDRPSNTSGSEATSVQPQDPQTRAASALTFAQDLISSARKALLLTEGAIPVRIGMFSGPSAWQNNSKASQADGSKDDSPLTRSAMAAVCVQRSCPPDRIQACAATVQALVASAQSELWEWQAGDATVTVAGQEPVSTYQWLLWMPAHAQQSQPDEPHESPGTPRAERRAVRASGSASHLQTQRRGSLVSQGSGTSQPVALSHDLLRVRSRGSSSRAMPSIALQYLQSLQSMSSINTDPANAQDELFFTNSMHTTAELVPEHVQTQP